LRPQPPHELRDRLFDAVGLRLRAPDLRDDLRQRYETAERIGPPAPRLLRPVRQLLDPVHHPDRQRLATGGAEALRLPRLGGLEAHAAGAMAVQVVLALFGEEFDRPPISLPGLQ